jgi:hypothetical protein
MDQADMVQVDRCHPLRSGLMRPNGSIWARVSRSAPNEADTVPVRRERDLLMAVAAAPDGHYAFVVPALEVRAMTGTQTERSADHREKRDPMITECDHWWSPR